MDLTSQFAPKTTSLFPLLKRDELISCMEDMGHSIRTDELENPSHHRERLREIYLFFLDICAGSHNPEQTSQAIREKMDSIQYPEIHQDLGDLNLFIAMRDFLQSAGCTDFAIRDLHQPTPKRLRTQLSAMINIACFREEKLPLYRECLKDRDLNIESLVEVNEETNVLKEQHDALQKMIKSQQPELDKIAQECEEMEAQIKDHNLLQSKIILETENLAKQSEEIGDQLEASKWELQELSVKEERLRSKLVSSPDRRKSELLLYQERLKKSKQQLEQQQERIQQEKINLQKAETACKELEACNAMWSQLQESVSSVNECRAKIETAQRESNETEREISKLQKQLSNAERALQRSEQTRKNVANQYVAQEKAMKEQFESSSAELMRAEAERQQHLSRVAAAQASTESMERALQEQNEQHAEKMAELQSLYENTVDQLVKVVQEETEQLVES